MIEGVHLFEVPCQVAGPRKGHATGGADVGPVAGMGAHVYRQIAGAREGLTAGGAWVGAVAGVGAHVCHQAVGPRACLAAGGALGDELASLPIPLPFAGCSRAFTRFFTRRHFPLPLAPNHREIRRYGFLILKPTGQTKKNQTGQLFGADRIKSKRNGVSSS